LFLFLSVVVTQLPMMEASAAQKSTRAKSDYVVLLRGIFDVFSLGLDDLALQLKRKGIHANVLSHGGRKRIAAKIFADDRKKRIRKLIIVGHSLGANAAVALAIELNSYGIGVDYLVTLDPTIMQPIPDNVRASVNYLLPQSSLGISLTRAHASTGSSKNIKLATTADFGHFNMTRDPELKRILMAAVLKALGRNRGKVPRHRNAMR